MIFNVKFMVDSSSKFYTYMHVIFTWLFFRSSQISDLQQKIIDAEQGNTYTRVVCPTQNGKITGNSVNL